MGQTSDLLKAAVNDVFTWSALMLSFQLVIGIAAVTVARTRAKHHAHALNAQVCLFAVMALSSFIFGWWIRQMFISGPDVIGGDRTALSAAWPWSESMGPWVAASGISGPAAGWLHHLLASWLVAALLSLAIAERIRGTAFFVLGIVSGSVCSSIAAAWMWSPAGWLVRLTGFHDAFGAASIHAVAGGFALGVLQVVGARHVYSASDASVVKLSVPTPWLASVGALFLIGGLVAFSAATVVPFGPSSAGLLITGAVGAYGTATPIFGVTGNFLLAVAAGLMVGHIEGEGHPTNTLAGGVAGLVTIAAGADRYYPLQAFLLAAFLVWLSLRFGRRLRNRHHIDDASGIVSIHGFASVVGLIAAGFLLWTMPSTSGVGAAMINPFGNTAGAVLAFFLLGQLPGYIVARFMGYLGVLRIPALIELAGSDLLKDLETAHQIGATLANERAVANDLTPLRP